MKTTTAIVSFVSGLVLAAAIPAQEHSGHGDSHAAHRRMMEQARSGDDLNVHVQLHDLELVDQYGKKVRFHSDVLGDRLAAITFTYSSCTTICPVFSALFTRLQGLLGDRLGREVVLITMTLDPTTDVPLRLQREAKKYQAKPGWYFLTGDKKNVDQVLRGLDSYFPDFTQHPPMALVGDATTGTWKRYNGFPQPELLVGMLDELRAARHHATGR